MASDLHREFLKNVKNEPDFGANNSNVRRNVAPTKAKTSCCTVRASHHYSTSSTLNICLKMTHNVNTVGRKGLLGWLNDFLQLDYARIEQVASGAAHCQIMDAIFPGKVPLHRVNFDAKYDYEFVRNYKILQEVFKEVGVVKPIDVNKLVKAKPQDNLEFLQWMKKFFDDNYAHGRDYPARERRVKCKVGAAASAPAASAATTKRAAPTSAPLNTSASCSTSITSDKENEAPAVRAIVNASTKTSAVVKKTSAGQVARGKPAVTATTRAAKQPANTQAAQVAELEAQVRKLTDKVAELKSTIATINPEKEFYFEKLRCVEIACQTHDPSSGITITDFIKRIEGILYAESHTPEALTEIMTPASESPAESDDIQPEEDGTNIAQALELDFDDVDDELLNMADLRTDLPPASTPVDEGDITFSAPPASSMTEGMIDLSAPISLGNFGTPSELDDDDLYF